MKLAALGIATIIFGAALSPVVMLALLGLLVTIFGGVVLAIAVANVQEEHETTPLTDGIGRLLGIIAGVGVAAVALTSTVLAAQHTVATTVRWMKTPDVSPRVLVLTIGLGLLVPSLTVAAIHLRTGWPLRRLVGWWLLTFSAQPSAVLVFMYFVAKGAPLTA